jgi:hypothetical protein
MPNGNGLGISLNVKKCPPKGGPFPAMEVPDLLVNCATGKPVDFV